MLLPFAPDLANQGARSVGPSDWLRDETLTQSSANQNLLELPGKAVHKNLPQGCGWTESETFTLQDLDLQRPQGL